MDRPELATFQDAFSYLKAVFAARQTRNPKYSLRAFAKDLELAPSSLSELMNQHYGLTLKKAEAIARRLNLSELEQGYFVELLRFAKATEAEEREACLNRMAQQRLEMHSQLIHAEWLTVIKEWYHMAIVELTKVEDFRSEASWVAKRLGLEIFQVEGAIERLKKLGLIVESDGEWKASVDFCTTTQCIPSDVIRQMHRQVFTLAQNSLLSQPVELRDNAFVVFAMNRSDLEASRDALQDFRREFMSRMERNPVKDSVYCLAVSLFPLDQAPK